MIISIFAEWIKPIFERINSHEVRNKWNLFQLDKELYESPTANITVKDIPLTLLLIKPIFSLQFQHWDHLYRMHLFLTFLQRTRVETLRNSVGATTLSSPSWALSSLGALSGALWAVLAVNRSVLRSSLACYSLCFWSQLHCEEVMVSHCLPDHPWSWLGKDQLEQASTVSWGKARDKYVSGEWLMLRGPFMME